MLVGQRIMKNGKEKKKKKNFFHVKITFYEKKRSPNVSFAFLFFSREFAQTRNISRQIKKRKKNSYSEEANSPMYIIFSKYLARTMRFFLFLPLKMEYGNRICQVCPRFLVESDLVFW